MFSLLAEEPVAAPKSAATSASTSSKPVQKAIVGGAKKSDAPKRMSPLLRQAVISSYAHI